MNQERSSVTHASIGALLALSIGVSGCATVSTTTRIDHTATDSKVETAPPTRRELGGTIEPNADGLAVLVTEARFCPSVALQSYRSDEKVERKVSKAWIVVEYALAGALLGFGAWAAFDSDGVSDAFGGGMTPSVAKATGYGSLGVGSVLLLSGVIDTTRGGTRERTLGNQVERGEPKEAACGEGPAAGIYVELAVPGQGSIPLGQSGDDGRLVYGWKSLPDQALDGASWPRKATVQVRNLRAAPADPKARKSDAPPPPTPLGEIDLTAAHDHLAERAFAALALAPSEAGASTYAARFPGLHEAELAAMSKPPTDEEREAAIKAALERGDVAAARAMMDAWKTTATDPARVSKSEAIISKVEADGKLGLLDSELAELSTASADQAGVERLERVAALLVELERVRPTDPRGAFGKKTLKKQRGKVHKGLTATAKKQLKQKAFADATASNQLALRAAGDDKKLVAATGKTTVAIARGLAQSAKPLAKADDFVAADKALADAEALAPGDKQIAKLKEQVAKLRAAYDKESEQLEKAKPPE